MKATTERVLEYVFPLREDFTATLWLPPDLSANEVRRITAMLDTLVVERDPNSPHECCFSLSDEEHRPDCPVSGVHKATVTQSVVEP